jgi:predicted signal transduction protein with EAL and GGDEF domain
MIVAKRLRGAVRELDTVARLGGDEFVVVAEGIETVEQAEALANRLNGVINRPIRLSDRRLVINVSTGIAIAWTPGAVNAEDLLRDADVALYQAKGGGRGRHAVFDAELRNRALRRLHLETDLRRAIDEESLSLVYQPIISLASGRALGVEALLRWTTSRYGPVPPSEFVPIAEETGLILDMGRQVFRMACAEAARWREQHPELRDLHVSVNLSPRQFADPELVGAVDDALRAGGLPGEALWIEITETVLMDDTAIALPKLAALREIGARVAIDDFGTGYSSLAYLRRLPVDALKIDRSFVADMGESDDDVIVPAIVGLAHNLNLEVIAEGVETADQLAALRLLRCDHVQGYYLGRPHPPAEVLDLLLRPGPVVAASER